MPLSRKVPSPPAAPRITSSAEFARYVGLARTTVSRVLNGQPGLKKKTIDKVQRAMVETGFTPNAYALHLKGKRTATIGICMENLLTPPAVKKLAALQRRLREHGFSSLIEVLDPGNGQKVIRHFQSMRVEAIVFIGHFLEDEVTARIAELSASNTPHLVIDHFGIRGANTVTLNRAAAMEELVGVLWDLGHRTFGLMGQINAPAGRFDRRPGIKAGLAARGTDIDTATVSLDHLHIRRRDFEYGRLLAQSFSQLPKAPTVYLALNDEIAVGAIHGFQEAGLRVPKDVSVTGFNNQDICEMITPSLTSVDQQIDATVEAATESLLEQLAQPITPRAVLRTITAKLIIRDSVGPV